MLVIGLKFLFKMNFVVFANKKWRWGLKLSQVISNVNHSPEVYIEHCSQFVRK